MNIRYYTRFKGEYGHVRVMVTHNKVRKLATLLDVPIRKGQARRLRHDGRLKPYTDTREDYLLVCRLRYMDKAIRATVNMLIARNQFADAKGDDLTKAIEHTLDVWSNDAHQRIYARMMQDGSLPNILTPQQIEELSTHVAFILTPDQRIIVNDGEKGGKV